ncbi:MAG TPA: four helix bundle protein [Pyrinomonadaceae bacterium]|nr:four helix bundle protein [Pyrinomonadaceae bacterium]
MFARNFEDVEIWKKSHAFVLSVYRLTENFPKHELFGLTSQLRRAAVSVPANFAEGFKKTGKADKLRFYNIAQGSLEECRYYLILVNDLNYGDVSRLKTNLEEISKMLGSYMQKIRNDR